jgi:hypothetical protein
MKGKTLTDCIENRLLRRIFGLKRDETVREKENA